MTILALLCVLACLLLVSGFCAWKINATFNMGVRQMTVNAETTRLLKKIDDATTAIGQEVQTVIDKLNAAAGQVSTGMTETEVADLNATLTGEADKLQTVADSLSQFAQGGTVPADLPADPTSDTPDTGTGTPE